MPGSTTELGLSTAVDSDDNADYLTVSLANSLRTVDALFNNVTGHTHGGAHQGAPVVPAAGSIPGTALANGSVTNAKLASDTARVNLLTNGGFEIWQRGTSGFIANGAWSADRWQITLGAGDTIGVARDTTNVDVGSQYCAYVNYTKSTGPATMTQSHNDSVLQFRQKTVTFSVRVKTNVANSVRLRCNDGVGGQQFSGYHSGSNTYETLSMSYAIAAGASSFATNVEFNVTCNAYLDNAMLVVGAQPADYAPLHPADDLARCLRYYEIVGGGNPPVGAGMAYGPASAAIFVPFKVVKAISPTLTISAIGDFQLYSAAGVGLTATGMTFPSVSPQGAQATVNVASGLVAGNGTLLIGANGNMRLLAEANP